MDTKVDIWFHIADALKALQSLPKRQSSDVSMTINNGATTTTERGNLLKRQFEYRKQIQ